MNAFLLVNSETRLARIETRRAKNSGQKTPLAETANSDELHAQTNVIDFQSRLIHAPGTNSRAIKDSNNSYRKLKLPENTLLQSYDSRSGK